MHELRTVYDVADLHDLNDLIDYEAEVSEYFRSKT